MYRNVRQNVVETLAKRKKDRTGKHKQILIFLKTGCTLKEYMYLKWQFREKIIQRTYAQELGYKIFHIYKGFCYFNFFKLEQKEQFVKY